MASCVRQSGVKESLDGNSSLLHGNRWDSRHACRGQHHICKASGHLVLATCMDYCLHMVNQATFEYCMCQDKLGYTAL